VPCIEGCIAFRKRVGKKIRINPRFFFVFFFAGKSVASSSRRQGTWHVRFTLRPGLARAGDAFWAVSAPKACQACVLSSKGILVGKNLSRVISLFHETGRGVGGIAPSISILMKKFYCFSVFWWTPCAESD
jgi:hypothetical protein